MTTRKIIPSVWIPVLACCMVSILSLLIYKYQKENPKAEWDKSPEALIISTEHAIPQHIDYNYIPDYRVWGDGYIVWVEYEPDGSRKVFEGHLSQDGVKDLVEQFIDAGFFKWFQVQGSASTSIRIELLDVQASKLSDNNEKIFQLANYLKSGARVTGKKYFPPSGELYVFPVTEKELQYYDKPQFTWPLRSFGYTLESVSKRYQQSYDSTQISGDDLLFAWEIVNSSQPLVEENGKVYWIGLIVPVSP